ncbi:MAG: hypothetical protein AB8B97_15350 [Granulosicoccus sp.]
MIKKSITTQIGRSLFAVGILLAFSIPASARITINPVDLTIDGGFTFNRGVSDTTSLFVDMGDRRSDNTFWVRVELNPGSPPGVVTIDSPITNQPPTFLQPKQIFIKYFPIERYVEVREAMRGIGNYGTVNPYVDDFVICDAPNSTIRLWKKNVFMAYNCGSDGPDADSSTFASEQLLKDLRQETLDDPDLQGRISQ